ncbi:inositol 2-dehydrogenase, partial [Salmonella enterica]|nr:inositol 2-dehydrogenase [Salmonella enterica]
NEAYVQETALFIDAIRNDTPVIVNGNDAVQAERVALAARMSMEQGRPVKLREVPGMSVESQTVAP